MEIGKVGVVGCGTMGSGICEVVARAGLPVVFVEVGPAEVEAGHQRIQGSLQRAVDRGKLAEEERDDILGRISGDVDFHALADADLVVEAVPEVLDVKQETMSRLADALKPEAIVATNTSSLAVIDIAVRTARPDRVLGFHFFNPAPVMKLIELVTTVVTAPDVVEDAQAFAARLGKTPVVAGDRAGFVANLLLFPYLNQAIGMVEDGYATREDVDAAMQLGAGHPMGPLALMDLIGLDSANSIMERMYEQFRDVRYAPRPLVRQLLAAGFKGRKSGRGFYPYAQANSPDVVVDHPRTGPGAGVDAVAVVAGWKTVGVLGTGTMAAGIAEVCAKAGFEVILRGRTAEKAQTAISGIEKSLAKAVERGRLDAAQRDAALERVRPTGALSDFGACDMVIEAVREDVELKRGLFAELESATKPEAVLATTTSSLAVIECAMATSRPERVLGVHFFNPASVMKLVEVVATVRTSSETTALARAFIERVKKRPVHCSDRSGFIVNALLFPYLNDAVKMLAEGYASTADIDTAMKLGCGHPMGPFELMDIVGLDVTLQICRALHAEFREPGFAPAPLLGHMVSAGYLGRKSGRGFHVYG
jgi:3-hydroxybutyryl-CoA dehydrogenase